ncbi:uncharacterized protein DS421_20g698670 [Arachis hypogaea]|nr:uncharacterized protein DS421_20g698670 [Arachis hypogaea]
MWLQRRTTHLACSLYVIPTVADRRGRAPLARIRQLFPQPSSARTVATALRRFDGSGAGDNSQG